MFQFGFENQRFQDLDLDALDIKYLLVFSTIQDKEERMRVNSIFKICDKAQIMGAFYKVSFFLVNYVCFLKLIIFVNSFLGARRPEGGIPTGLNYRGLELVVRIVIDVIGLLEIAWLACK